MKRHAKAASAGSNSSRGTGLGSIRRAFATRGALGDAEGSGAPSGRSRLAFIAVTATFALCLLAAPAAFANGTLNVVIAGSGSGTVTSTSEQIAFGLSLGTGTVTPGQLNCTKAGGAGCSATFFNAYTFEYGATEMKVTLSAAAAPGGGPFVGWAVDGEIPSQRCSIPPAATPTCEVTLNGNPGPTTTVYAVFGSPPDPPSATSGPAVPGPAEHLTSFQGDVNPNGLAVLDCRFVYGTTTAYGKSTACDQSLASLGSGNADKPVTATTELLEPNTTYHFRLRASNFGGSGQSKDRTFTTGPAPTDPCPNADIRTEQGVEVMLLPECMALEQVSPFKKGNQSAREPKAVSDDGKRVLYNSIATLGNCPNVNAIGGDLFIANRDPDAGWGTECVNPQIANGIGSGLQQFSFTPDLSSWLQFISSSQGPSFVQEGLGGFLRFLSPGLQSIGGVNNPGFLGASGDHSHLYFWPEFSIDRSGSFLPGDPQPAGAGEDSNLYVTQLDSEGEPSFDLFARDRDGKVWGANCGARLGGMEPSSGTNLNVPNGLRNQGAISPDGSHVYFSTRPGQPPTGNCTEANKKRIMERVETPTGPLISEVISSECDRVSPPCSSTDGDDIYQGASLDQSKIYFTTNRQLADTDLDGSSASCIDDSPPSGFEPVAGCDLYLYDRSKPAGERLTQVSTGTDATPGEGADVVNGVATISSDGSRVYFAAAGVLTTDPSPSGATAVVGKPNFYSWDAETETITFIGTLGTGPAFSENDGGFLGSGLWGGDSGAFPVPIKGTDSQGDQVGGDGHVLLFQSVAPLTADDTDGNKLDIFRYDADAGTLERVSKAGPGGSDNGPFSVLNRNGFLGTGSTDFAEKGRWVSEDGETVVLTTKEPLLPGDLNGAQDSYLWHAGQLYHLPGSSRASASARAIEPVLAADGSVAYHSTKQLTPSDGDSTEDVYILRAGGGFRTPVRSVCEGEACQGAPSTLSDEIGATTGVVVGGGNLKAQGTQARGCPKGKHKVRRGGKSRCVKPAKHKKQASHQKKRAGAKQGGQK